MRSIHLFVLSHGFVLSHWFVLSLWFVLSHCFVLGLLVLAPFATAAEKLRYQVIARVEQPPFCFTQGLLLHDNWFYQSCGQYGQSHLVRFAKDNPKQSLRVDMPADIFAEGIALVGNEIFLVSWREQKGFVFNANTLQMKREFRYSGEGWGLTYTGTHLAMSDGSAQLKLFDPRTFTLQSTLNVTHAGVAIDNLNELEFANGVIWANRWHSTAIYGIAPSSGEVIAQFDIGELMQEAASGDLQNVANGIAWDDKEQGFWVTGKYWRYRYLLRLQSHSVRSE